MAVGTTYDLKTERAVTGRPRRVDYPIGDGEPMAETDKHVLLIVNCLSALRLFYAEAQDRVYVAANNFLFYEEGNPRAKISPDTYVVFGVPTFERDSYKTWEEGSCMPSVVFEFTSKKTQDDDLGKKYHLYEQVLKVSEYFLFDPTNDYITESLRGFRLEAGRYIPISLTDNRMRSEQLNLDLIVEGERMRLFDPQTSRILPTLTESDTQRQAETIRADAEAKRAVDAEAENARLRAEIAALRGR